ncbi:MAG: DUF5989 family protein [Planctomycetota bacterium]
MDDQRDCREEVGRGEEFERHAQGRAPGLVVEFVEFLLHNKKWWLIPILLVLAALFVLVVLGGSGAAPFIYTLF